MDLEIPVEFQGQQKWITGLSRGTTCDDVIYALLRHDLGPNQNIDVSTYRMYEEWQDCERTLSGRTKIMKLWRALGSDARHVRLVIRLAHTSDILDTGSEMSYGTRTRRAKRQSKTNSPFKHQSKLTALSKSEIYDYYYRKEKRRRETDHMVHQNIDDLYSYVAMVTKQEQELEKIASQISAIDASISQYEAAQIYSGIFHVESTNANSDSTPSFFPAIKANDVEAYLHMCESLVELHENIEQTHSKSCYLESILIREKSSKLRNTPQDQIEKGIAKIHEELDKCSALSVSQQNELDLLEEAVFEYERQILEKQTVVQELITQIQKEDQIPTNRDTSHGKDNNNHDWMPKKPSNLITSRSLSNVEINNLHRNSNTISDVFNFPSHNKLHKQGHFVSNPALINEHLSKRNASNKEFSERAKGVRFKLDVTKWMYDVLSEDDSQWESAGSDMSPTKQYSQNLEYNTTSPNRNTSVSTVITKQTVTSNSGIIAGNKKNLSSTIDTPQEASMIPYTTYMRPGGSTIFTGADDSNSDTGLSSMNSEEDPIASPLETLV